MARIWIFLFDDRWEVISPGRLPGPVRVEALGGERLDRNPVIADALRTFGYMEGMGTGIHRIRHILKHHGFREPLFEEAGNTVRILRQEFPKILMRLPSMWTRSYFVSTAGNVSSETIQRYIESQSTRA